MDKLDLEIKKELIEQIVESISAIQNIDALCKIRDLADELSPIDFDDDLTEEQILSLKKSIAQSENPDQCISHEEITTKYNNLYGN